jgi:hypothetical protein
VLSLVTCGHQSASSTRGGHSHGAAGMTIALVSSARMRSYHARHKANVSGPVAVPVLEVVAIPLAAREGLERWDHFISRPLIRGRNPK